MTQSFSKEDLLVILKKIGCQSQQVDQCLCLYENQMYQEMIRLLKCQRCILLNDVHDIQKQIDCLDYLLYQLKEK